MRQAPTTFVYSEMNVTPFIDVLLVLLVVFMLLNLFGRTTIRAQVPPTAGAPAVTTVQLRPGIASQRGVRDQWPADPEG